MNEPLTFRLRSMFACACTEPAEAADRIEKLEAALVEIFDHECRTSQKSFIACVARDALWPQALDAK
jgi:hypothetical protein